MTQWQKRARIGVAIVGLVSVAAVYVTFRGRQTAPPPTPIQRLDPKAIAETVGSVLKRFGSEKLGELNAESCRNYEDGSTKCFQVVIIVPKGPNRTFKITANESHTGKDQIDVELIGSVKAEDSDGFWLTTDRATFNQQTSIANVPGTAAFGKGGMSGSGTRFSYDQMRDVLLVGSDAHVQTIDKAGKPVMQFSSGTAMLDRGRHLLLLDTGVHVIRQAQLIDSDYANARLSTDNDVINFVELRGNSRVSGGTSIETMNARDIDLDYSDDGQTLEASKMVGNAAIALKGQNGQAGRRIASETLNLALAADGSLTSAIGRGSVRLDLPAGESNPGRSITAQSLDATGQTGKGLTSATFTTNVGFTEEPRRSGESGAAADATTGRRTAHAQKLEASLADDAVTSATFTGDVSFEETGLKACSARLEYQPDKGSLALSGATAEGNPIVAEEQLWIEGQAIDVALDNRHMTAKGEVTTRMRTASRRCRPASSRPPAEQGATNVPRLLKADGAVTVVGEALDYDGDTGYAVYTGTQRRPKLDQGDTTISADKIVIDQTKGDLTATGGAIAALSIDNDRTTGRAHEITYRDADRVVRYLAATAGKGAPAAAATRAPASADVSLDTSTDTLRAGNRIEIRLAADENTVERMQAFENVRVNQATRTVSGGARLEYTAAEQKYEVTGAGTVPVLIVSRDGANCREDTGKLVTFYKGENQRVVIDGKDMRRTATLPSKSGCAQSNR